MDYREKKVARTMREHAIFDSPLEIKSLDASGYFAGYASVFDVIDNQRDVVLRGAFRQSINSRKGQIKLLWQHAMDEPIGITTELFEDGHGLYMEGQLLLEVARAREAYALLKQGVVTGLSIGYAPLRYSRDPDSGLRLLREVELYEISLVTFPANSAAEITSVKGIEKAELAELQRAVEQACHVAGGLTRGLTNGFFGE